MKENSVLRSSGESDLMQNGNEAMSAMQIS